MNMSGSVSSAAEWRAARARLAEAGAATSCATRIGRLRSRCRGTAAQAHARQLAMYLAHVVFGLNYTQIGLCFGRDRTTVRHACARIEDARDDRLWDGTLSALELALTIFERRLHARLARVAETRR